MKVQFTLTRSDSKAASKLIAKLHPKISWVKIADFFGAFIGALLVTISVIVLFGSFRSLFRSTPEVAFSIAGLVIGISIFIGSRLYVGRLYSKYGLYGSVMTYELLEDKIVAWTNDNMKTEILPTAIRKVIQYRGFQLIYVGEAYAYFIPLHAFSNDTERDSFLERLRQISAQSA